MNKWFKIAVTVGFVLTSTGAWFSTSQVAHASLSEHCPPSSVEKPATPVLCPDAERDEDRTTFVNGGNTCKQGSNGVCCTYKRLKEFCTSNGTWVQTIYTLDWAWANKTCVKNTDGTGSCQ